MTPKTFRMSKNGYDKNAVLSRLNEINLLIIGVQQGTLSSEDAKTQERQLLAEPLPEVKGFFKSGFNKEDVDSYMCELRDVISYGKMG